MAKTQQRDIQVVPPNPDSSGHDKTLADLHGAKGCLEDALASLKPGDRLFSAGDLTDRGEDSPGVIELLIKNKDRVFVIRGNHENLCLDDIDSLEKLALKSNGLKDPNLDPINEAKQIDKEENKDKKKELKKAFQQKYGDPLSPVSISPVTLHISNGGGWLVKLFREELQNGKIEIKADEEGKKIINYTADSKVSMIKNYMSNLPYIIHAQVGRHFNMVHADMPFDDQELQKRIDGQGLLSDEEKKYVTWAVTNKPGKRSSTPIKFTGRNEASVVTYVGHQITAEEEGAASVRYETNTVDLDGAAYKNKASVIVDHTDGTCDIIGPGAKQAKKNVFLMKAVNEINEHAQAQKQLGNFLQEIKQAKTLSAINEIVNKWSQKIIPHRDADGKPVDHFSADYLRQYAANHHINPLTKPTPKTATSTSAIAVKLGGNKAKAEDALKKPLPDPVPADDSANAPITRARSQAGAPEPIQRGRSNAVTEKTPPVLKK